ncbi:MAG TPA: histidine kinase dimerization/phosphoacceptor domain-containing protein [Actinopolymorphaceae bacterium]
MTESASTWRLGAWRSRRDVAVDTGVLLVAAALTLVITAYGSADDVPYPAWPGSLAFAMVVVTAALTWRRRFVVRLLTMAVVAGVAVGFVLTAPGPLVTAADPTNLWMPLAPLAATYGAHLYERSRRRAWTSLIALTLIVAHPWSVSLTAVTAGLFHVSVPMLFGMYIAARRILVRTLTERAERAERERHLVAERARDAERVRLAAEMHDIVTHRISLMVLHAGALRVTATDDGTRQIAEEVRATGCAALEELRDLIGVLRTPRRSETATSVGDTSVGEDR